MKIIETIKFEGRNLNDIFGKECVSSVDKDCNGKPVIFLKSEYTLGRPALRRGEYLCKFANGMWQVFGAVAYENLIKNTKNDDKF